MSWSGRRRFGYATGVIVFLLLVAGVPLFLYVYDAPTCFDNEHNGSELGVDCGGSCQLLCEFQADDPTILWSRSFEVTPNNYSAVAYVENPNPKAAVDEIGYTFRLFDADNILIVERAGTTFLLPGRITPIFEADLFVGNRVPVRTFFEFNEDPQWLVAEDNLSLLSVRDRVLSNPETSPRLDATLENTSVEEFKDVEVVAVVFGTDGNAVATSKTFFELIEKRMIQDLVFTWPAPFPKRVEACTAPADVMLLLDVSGSMNDDGDDPPQPLTDAKRAAAAFVNRLDVLDKSGFVTFATEGELQSALTLQHGNTREEVLEIEIDPEEERGFTNMGSAISKADVELSSVRHNADARKIAVLLTDGKANAPEDPGGEAFALQEATLAKSKDVIFYTIGLGEDINQEFLQELAGSSERSFLAPTSKDLDGIYREISADICERGPAVIDIIPKTKDAFFSEPVMR